MSVLWGFESKFEGSTLVLGSQLVILCCGLKHICLYLSALKVIFAYLHMSSWPKKAEIMQYEKLHWCTPIFGFSLISSVVYPALFTDVPRSFHWCTPDNYIISLHWCTPLSPLVYPDFWDLVLCLHWCTPRSPLMYPGYYIKCLHWRTPRSSLVYPWYYIMSLHWCTPLSSLVYPG